MHIDRSAPKDLVRRSYDQISYAYRCDSVKRDRDYFIWLEALTPLVHPGATILDLGCGCGVPVAQELAQRFQVTGVDLSEVQIARARQLVPQATFLCTDMTALRFPSETFAAIVSFFAIIHLPVHEHRPLLERCFAWLQPGGTLMATVGHQAWTGYQDTWYGAPMYWSHADEAMYLRWLQEIGFVVLWTQCIPEGAGGHAGRRRASWGASHPDSICRTAGDVTRLSAIVQGVAR
jgi:SAM-dependent methyltransferase